MATRKKKQTVEEQLAVVLERLERTENEKAALASMLARATPGMATAGQAVVGIRNVCNSTIGITGSPLPHEPEVQLHASFRGEQNPNSVAIISWVWWQQLRKGPLVGRGQIVRDDSILGPNVVKAPDDLAHEMHPDWQKNLVLDPHDFITNQSEQSLRAAIRTMTSEESLRRLWRAVDEKVGQARLAYDEGDPEREAKAVRDLPAIYQVAESLVQARLDEIGPARSY